MPIPHENRSFPTFSYNNIHSYLAKQRSLHSFSYNIVQTLQNKVVRAYIFIHIMSIPWICSSHLLMCYTYLTIIVIYFAVDAGCTMSVQLSSTKHCLFLYSLMMKRPLIPPPQRLLLLLQDPAKDSSQRNCVA